jgi:integrase
VTTTLNFTKAALQTIEAPTERRRDLYRDAKTKGLFLFVTESGKKTFYLYRKVQGKPTQISIGAFPDLTIEQARRKAEEFNGQIAQGANPQEVVRGKRSELTLLALFNEVMERHLKPRRRRRTIEAYDRQFRVHLKPWHKRKLSQIHQRDVLQLHSNIGQQSGHFLANRVLALISMLYGKAEAWGHWSGVNPCKGVEKFKEQSRDRFLQPDEIPRFFKALAEEPNTTARDCIMMCLLTGARRGNVQAMRWEEVSLVRNTWRIPDTKTGEPLLVPLVPKAVELLMARQEASEGSPWVFPGKVVGKHIVELKTVWARILERADIQDLRMHDLRRSLGSWMAAKGASLTIIGKGLGHKSTSTTAIYSRLNIDPVREAMDEATEAMFEAALIVGDAKNHQ